MVGKFFAYVDKLIRDNVPWHPGVPSVHLDLIHGQRLLEHFWPIPLGWLSEENLESHNKIKKQFRLHHTAKISREATMRQWIFRSVDSSDPLVLEASLEHRLKNRIIYKIEDYPKIIQDMILKDHPYNDIEF